LGMWVSLPTLAILPSSMAMAQSTISRL